MAKQYKLKILKNLIFIASLSLLLCSLLIPIFSTKNRRVKINATSKAGYINSTTTEIIEPNLHGQDNNGNPYSIRAKLGYKTDGLDVKLIDIKADFVTSNKDKGYKITALGGETKDVFKLLYLYGNVNLDYNHVINIVTEKLTVNYKELSAKSDAPIYVKMKNLELRADRLEILPNGDEFILRGNVKGYIS